MRRVADRASPTLRSKATALCLFLFPLSQRLLYYTKPAGLNVLACSRRFQAASSKQSSLYDSCSTKRGNAIVLSSNCKYICEFRAVWRPFSSSDSPSFCVCVCVGVLIDQHIVLSPWIARPRYLKQTKCCNFTPRSYIPFCFEVRVTVNCK